MLARQRHAVERDRIPDPSVRVDRLQRCIDVLVENRRALAVALDQDFGHRGADATDAEIASTILALKHARRRVGRWMRPDRRSSGPLRVLGARSEVRYQPLGVVGVIAPWNGPIYLSFGPLAGVLAAGNRAMVKLSENAPATAETIAGAVRERFETSELAIVTGGLPVARAFSALPFDHLVYTGSGAVARQILASAAENLVPVTLELGGKNPAIVDRSARVAHAARAIARGKLSNGGQVCVAPDYAFVHTNQLEQFLTSYRSEVSSTVPRLHDRDYVSIINEPNYVRQLSMLDEAHRSGCRVITLSGDGERGLDLDRKLAPHVVVDPPDELELSQAEVFGPTLVVRTYERIDEVIGYINARPHPLALYFFGSPGAERTVLDATTSGGVCVGDTVAQVAIEDLPFGGVGPSGMGRYHGRSGFDAFSHHRSVLRQSPFDPTRLLTPPYGRLFRATMNALIRR